MATYLKYENGLLVPAKREPVQSEVQNSSSQNAVIMQNQKSNKNFSGRNILNVLIMLAILANTLLTIAVAIQLS